jgi:hypothetical protein
MKDLTPKKTQNLKYKIIEPKIYVLRLLIGVAPEPIFKVPAGTGSGKKFRPEPERIH